MKNKLENKYKLLFLVLVLVLPNVAMAEPWDSLADSVLAILTGGVTRTVAIIVCIGLGIAAWGIVFVFGAAAIVDFFIGTVS